MICIKCGKDVILEGVECPKCGCNNANEEKEIKVVKQETIIKKVEKVLHKKGKK